MKLSIFLALTVSCSLVQAAAWPRPEPVGESLPPLQVKLQDDEFDGEVTIRRLRLNCPAGPCVVFRKDGRLASTRTAAFQNLGDWLKEVGGSLVEDREWGLNDRGQPFRLGDLGDPRFNCHSYVLSDVGMTPADWVQGAAHDTTEKRNPMELFLQSYFDRVALFEVPRHQPRDIESSGDIRDGDVMVLTAKGEGDQLHHVHAGRLRRQDGKLRLRSKLGEAFPVVDTPWLAAAAVYARKFNEVRVYRLKPAPR